MGWLYLGAAIILELTGTMTMKYSEGFSRLLPSILMFVLYGCSFTFLSFAVKTLELSMAYAIWSGLGTVLITTAGVILYGERINLLKIICVALIILGVAGLRLTSISGKPG
ncbi:multidrug efflux SMR transporter [Paenibacillus zeisoli]|uniref:Multidrug efflux SMR transporter n=1 Tax=Paenibacillus zeisoli TaxID=2496267 RepID=A0A433X2V1_9BACL|nr:multidrug efflux SMR transporter [Paenibacillus zeisoli]RUT28393.1 multidrug efflux SMR transporter [Paenibacillus zeisoli]